MGGCLVKEKEMEMVMEMKMKKVMAMKMVMGTVDSRGMMWSGVEEG